MPFSNQELTFIAIHNHMYHLGFFQILFITLYHLASKSNGI